MGTGDRGSGVQRRADTAGSCQESSESLGTRIFGNCDRSPLCPVWPSLPGLREGPGQYNHRSSPRRTEADCRDTDVLGHKSELSEPNKCFELNYYCAAEGYYFMIRIVYAIYSCLLCMYCVH